MKSKDVAKYLVNHPNFFNEHVNLLADLQIPHPQQDNVVSIHERQAQALKDKNKILQEKLLELINFGEENDAISEKMHRLTIALLTACHFDDFLNGLYYSLREDFDIPYFALRLWGLNYENTDNDAFEQTSEDIHAIAEGLAQPYCGGHVAKDIKDLFGDDAEHLQSFSMIPLNTSQTIGLLVLASPEAERFYADMGILHLKRLGEIASASIARHELTGSASEEMHRNLSNE